MNPVSDGAAMCQTVNARLPLPRNAKENADLYNAFKDLGHISGVLVTVFI